MPEIVNISTPLGFSLYKSGIVSKEITGTLENQVFYTAGTIDITELPLNRTRVFVYGAYLVGSSYAAFLLKGNISINTTIGARSIGATYKLTSDALTLGYTGLGGSGDPDITAASPFTTFYWIYYIFTY